MLLKYLWIIRTSQIALESKNLNLRYLHFLVRKKPKYDFKQRLISKIFKRDDANDEDTKSMFMVCEKLM